MNDRWDDEWEMTHPTMIEVGTMSVYLTYDEIRRLISVLQEGEALKDYLRGKQREYERRMKDAT